MISFLNSQYTKEASFGPDKYLETEPQLYKAIKELTMAKDHFISLLCIDFLTKTDIN